MKEKKKLTTEKEAEFKTLSDWIADDWASEIGTEKVKEFIKILNRFSDNRRDFLKKREKGVPKEMIEWIEGCRDGYRQLISELNKLAGKELTK